MKNKYFLYVRQYSIVYNDYRLYVYLVETEDIFHTIGEMYYRALEHIKRIDFVEYTKEKENYWLENGYKIDAWHDKYINNKF